MTPSHLCHEPPNKRRVHHEDTAIRLMEGQHSLWETADACCNSAIPEACQVDILDILHVAG